MTEESCSARMQALAQVESIAEMVAALNCDFDLLDDLREELEDLEHAVTDAALDEDCARVRLKEADTEEESRQHLAAIDKASAEHAAAVRALADWREANQEVLSELQAAAGSCENHDEAAERIQSDALSVEVRSGWGDPGETLTPDEFRIVLCTGGPHVELVGGLNQYAEPCSVRVLYRDWGTRGELSSNADHDALLTYCQQFYFGS